MLVHVSQSFVFGRLCERSVLYVDLDRRQRYAMVLHDYHFQAVSENLALDDFLQLRSLAPRVHGSQR